MTRRLVAALVTSTLLGCGAADTVSPPDPDLSAMEPQVAELLAGARRAVVEHESAETWGELGSVYDAHGLLAEAEQCYRRAGELDPQAFDWSYLLAVVREVQGAETEEVVTLFDRAAALDPDYAAIPVRLGAALALRGENERAREAFERAVRMAPDSAVAQRGLGQVLLALGQADLAAEHLSRAVELQPADLSAYAGLSQAYMRLGRPELAEATAARAEGLQPIDNLDDPVYGTRVFMRAVGSSRAYARAQAAMRLGAWEQAVADLALVLRARPEDASTHYWKGLAHRRLKQNRQALEHLQRAVELDPGMAAARRELGAVLVAEGRYSEAVEQYESAARLGPLDAPAHLGLAQAYEKTGQSERAREHYREARQGKGQSP